MKEHKGTSDVHVRWLARYRWQVWYQCARGLLWARLGLEGHHCCLPTFLKPERLHCPRGLPLVRYGSSCVSRAFTSIEWMLLEMASSSVYILFFLWRYKNSYNRLLPVLLNDSHMLATSLSWHYLLCVFYRPLLGSFFLFRQAPLFLSLSTAPPADLGTSYWASGRTQPQLSIPWLCSRW